MLQQQTTYDMVAITTVRMAILPTAERVVYGPVTKRFYSFMPWADVDFQDSDAMLALTATIGCGCNGTQKTIPLFGTEEDIMNGKVTPDWKGRFGT